jgi:predicted GIY-YIG superfamily endonuclease
VQVIFVCNRRATADAIRWSYDRSLSERGFVCEGTVSRYMHQTKNMHFVYILRCYDGTHYTGCTNDLNDRLRRHLNGQVNYTKSKLPVELVFYCAFTDKHKAYEFERYLKSGSGRAFMTRRFLSPCTPKP